jgi:hypothetical protein
VQQQEPSGRPADAVITGLENQFKGYFASIANSGDYASTKAKCLAEPYIAGTFKLSSALPAEFANQTVTGNCMKSYSAWMYRGDTCNIALFVPDTTGCAGGVAKVTYNSDGEFGANDCAMCMRVPCGMRVHTSRC